MKKIISGLLTLFLIACGSSGSTAAEPESSAETAETIAAETAAPGETSASEEINASVSITDWLTSGDIYVVMYNYGSPQTYDFYDVYFQRFTPIDDTYTVYADYKTILDEMGYPQENVFAIEDYRPNRRGSDSTWINATADNYNAENNWSSTISSLSSSLLSLPSIQKKNGQSASTIAIDLFDTIIYSYS